MPRLKFQCKYCGHLFTEYVYDIETKADCPVCKDKCSKEQIIVTGDMFGYNYNPKRAKSAQSGNVFGYDPEEEAAEKELKRQQ